MNALKFDFTSGFSELGEVCLGVGLIFADQCLRERNVFNEALIHGFGKAPFYASLVTPAMQATSGGIKTDENAQTYYENGKPINGLYAAGGVSGHGTYSNEVGWAAVRDLAFGRIAGTNAAKFAKTQK